MYEYMICGDDLYIYHSDVIEGGIVRVLFEKQDEIYGTKNAEFTLPNYALVYNRGFTTEEMTFNVQFLRNNVSALMSYARQGGIENADCF